MINGGARELVEGKEEAGSGPPGAEWADVAEGPVVPPAPGVSPAPPLFSAQTALPCAPRPSPLPASLGQAPSELLGCPSPGPLAHTG